MQDDRKESVANSTSPQTESALLKDLMIPASIIIAGLFIGGGMYFGGGSSPQNGQVDDQRVVAAPKKSDNTDKVNPVTSDEHIKGNPDASVMIVVYSDFDCPFCNRFHDSMTKIIEKDSDLAWVYRQFPIEQLHPQATSVAMASECVAEIGGNDAFWIFTDGYYAARGSGDKTLHSELIFKLVDEASVSQSSFTECFESGRHLEDIQYDLSNGAATGGGGTPWSIIIGPTGKTYPVNGAVPQQVIEQMVEVARQEA